ncbi:MerR family regulatory protein [Pelotomaculum schinkii]|uniref:MerR family regulatory protein n=1 Tax=Pelotomaculum schinkii TaxID=78350 RepID=A0A4Y7RAX1_9FIRM|nr:MerR family DNA-binding transcriptional regulator [Pelotomaculum schinkii]TEB06114.1 MerR family regulatory protein [Pelotomaculum schinkii]TEB12871.1 MerR family regulatory protein [Pelotomaculum sp. FP]
MEKLLTSHQLAKLLNVWPHTLHCWEREGKLKPLLTPGGHRRYKESQIMTSSFSARIYGKRGWRVAKKLTWLIEQEVTACENHG